MTLPKDIPARSSEAISSYRSKHQRQEHHATQRCEIPCHRHRGRTIHDWLSPAAGATGTGETVPADVVSVTPRESAGGGGQRQNTVLQQCHNHHVGRHLQVDRFDVRRPYRDRHRRRGNRAACPRQRRHHEQERTADPGTQCRRTPVFLPDKSKNTLSDYVADPEPVPLASKTTAALMSTADLTIAGQAR